MQKSVRASCIAAQKPCLRNFGILVVAIATRISINRGHTVEFVKRPTISKAPHTISETNERPEELGSENADVRKPASAQSNGKKEFLNAFREEDSADHEAEQEQAPWDPAGR